jgi:hypothetical protein
MRPWFTPGAGEVLKRGAVCCRGADEETAAVTPSMPTKAFCKIFPYIFAQAVELSAGRLRVWIVGNV